MSDLLSSTFADLLSESYEDGADLIKWGGDAMPSKVQATLPGPRVPRTACEHGYG